MEAVQLQPTQLCFLLDDLVRKLDHSLLATAGKRRCFLKVLYLTLPYLQGDACTRQTTSAEAFSRYQSIRSLTCAPLNVVSNGLCSNLDQRSYCMLGPVSTWRQV